MPRGRKAKRKQTGKKRFCFYCRRPIVWVTDFFFDPNYSPNPYHVACVLRLGKHDPTPRFFKTYLGGGP